MQEKNSYLRLSLATEARWYNATNHLIIIQVIAPFNLILQKNAGISDSDFQSNYEAKLSE